MKKGPKFFRSEVFFASFLPLDNLHRNLSIPSSRSYYRRIGRRVTRVVRVLRVDTNIWDRIESGGNELFLTISCSDGNHM